ncbi:MAG: fasciclin domain-containing protein [Candidatus Hydrogenedentes bacterium]|nr:fasciclin domain-containing protein [Candidatus Hydrogenedentota bacterium]
MKEKLMKILKPASFLAVAAVAAGSFIATAGDGTCPLSGKAAKAEGTCSSDAKAAKAEGTCNLSLKAAKAEGKGECCPDGAAKPAVNTTAGTEAGFAKDGACEDGVCPLTGKQVADKGADCEGGVCPTSGKQVAEKGDCEGGVCPSGQKDIVNTAIQDGSFSTLLLAARAAGMMDKLNCPQPKTILAPTNEAFQKLPAEQWASLLQDDEAMQAVLARHIIDGAIPAADLAKEGAVCSSLGAKQCSVSGKTTIGSANVVRADIAASNGYIHAIDQVLLPEQAEVAAAESTEQPEDVKVAAAE